MTITEGVIVAVISVITAIIIQVFESRRSKKSEETDLLQKEQELVSDISNSVWARAESTMKALEAELKACKAESLASQTRLDTKIDELEKQIIQERERRLTQDSAFRAYFVLLIDGINQLTTQLTNLGIEPVWKPPQTIIDFIKDSTDDDFSTHL